MCVHIFEVTALLPGEPSWALFQPSCAEPASPPSSSSASAISGSCWECGVLKALPVAWRGCRQVNVPFKVGYWGEFLSGEGFPAWHRGGVPIPGGISGLHSGTWGRGGLGSAE